MERLTKEGKFCDVIECELTPGGSFCERGTCTERRLWERLSSIEDILGDDYDLDRLRELVEADRGGRCVVLPCKVGESLWIHDKDGKPREMILDEPDIRCHCKEEDNLCMVLCRAKHTGVCAMRLRNDGSSIGKTVFLTREEAEAALRRGRND